MRESEYKKAKLAFEEERTRRLREVEQEFQENMRVLERLYRMGQPASAAGETPRPPRPARERQPATTGSSPRRGQIYDAIREAVDATPGTFDFRQIHTEVCHRLGMPVNLSSVSSGLIKMAVREGAIEVVRVGTGRGATIYRKSGGPRLAAVQ